LASNFIELHLAANFIEFVWRLFFAMAANSITRAKDFIEISRRQILLNLAIWRILLNVLNGVEYVNQTMSLKLECFIEFIWCQILLNHAWRQILLNLFGGIF
jgi:hypothetical protein